MQWLSRCSHSASCAPACVASWSKVQHPELGVPSASLRAASTANAHACYDGLPGCQLAASKASVHLNLSFAHSSTSSLHHTFVAHASALSAVSHILLLSSSIALHCLHHNLSWASRRGTEYKVIISSCECHCASAAAHTAACRLAAARPTCGTLEGGGCIVCRVAVRLQSRPGSQLMQRAGACSTKQQPHLRAGLLEGLGAAGRTGAGALSLHNMPCK